MFSTSLFVLDTAVIKARVSLGTVGGTISTEDSETGDTLMVVITNPHGPPVEITSCVGERSNGWLGRGRERFRIPMHGLPFCFEEDGDTCLAWTKVTALPSLDGLVQLYVQDTHGDEWPLENTETLLQIRDRLRRPRS